MDPNTCFSELLEAVAANDPPEAYGHAENLLTWLDRGGFAPGSGKLRETSIRQFCNWVKNNYREELHVAWAAIKAFEHIRQNDEN